MNEFELRAKEIQSEFTLLHQNHDDLMEYFQKSYLSKIESLSEEEYLNMKSWIKEYDRMLTILQRHLINFEKFSHEVEHPDEDDLMKKAVTLTVMMSWQNYPKYNLYNACGAFNVSDSTQSTNDKSARHLDE